MQADLSYLYNVLKKTINLFLIIVGIYITVKLLYFYMPFLVAFILSLLIEPIIKFFMKKTNYSRKLSSIIIFLIVFLVLIGIIVAGIVTLVSEANNLLQMLNFYINKVYIGIQDVVSNIRIEKTGISNDIFILFQDTSQDLLLKISAFLSELLSNILNFFTSIPNMAIYIVITILSLYFICTDRIYILDFMEHHISKKWVQKLTIHIKEISQNLGGYLKAQLILIGISFIISLIGFYILTILKFNIQYPLLIALRNSICRCSPYSWFWNCNGTLGNYFSIKWRYKITEYQF